MMKASYVLRKAAHVVLERGLRKGFVGYDQGPVCAWGAMSLVATGDTFLPSSIPDVGRWEEPGAGIVNSTLALWNDLPETTAEDVASLLYSEAEVVE